MVDPAKSKNDQTQGNIDDLVYPSPQLAEIIQEATQDSSHNAAASQPLSEADHHSQHGTTPGCPVHQPVANPTSYGHLPPPLQRAPGQYSTAMTPLPAYPTQGLWPAPNLSSQPTFTRGGQYIGMPFDPEPGRRRRRADRGKTGSRQNRPSQAGLSTPSRHVSNQGRSSQIATSNVPTPSERTPPASAPPSVDGRSVSVSLPNAQEQFAPHLPHPYGNLGLPGLTHADYSLYPRFPVTPQGRVLTNDYPCGQALDAFPHSLDRESYSQRATAGVTDVRNEQPNATHEAGSRYMQFSLGIRSLDVIRRLSAVAIECDQLRHLLIESLTPGLGHNLVCHEQNAIEQANAYSVQHNYQIVDLDEPLQAIFPTTSDMSLWCLESVPATARQIMELDHPSIDILLRSYGFDAITNVSGMPLYDKKAVYLRLIGANAELTRKVLD